MWGHLSVISGGKRNFLQGKSRMMVEERGNK